MTFAGVSRHVGVLETAGLVKREVRGREHWLSLQPDALTLAERWISEQTSFWARRAQALAERLERRHVVFDEWTDATRLAEWMCPRPARCLNVEADPRVGGTVRFDVEEAGRTFRVSGNYLTLERPHRVAFTWSCSTWPDPTIQSVVTVTIEPDGAEASIMTIEHELLPPALVQQHARGWALITTQLESRLRPTARSRGHRW